MRSDVGRLAFWVGLNALVLVVYILSLTSLRDGCLLYEEKRAAIVVVAKCETVPVLGNGCR
jgi:hypothetical protein